MIVQILCALLITGGLFLLLNMKPSFFAESILRPFIIKRNRRERIRRITGKRKGRLTSIVDDARDMLWAAGMNEHIGAYRWAAILLAALGLLIGLMIYNIPAAFVLAAGMGCSPLIVIRIRTADYTRSLHEKLESAMGTVTNSYISSGDIIGAVESSLHLIPSPLNKIFQQFYTETQFIDSDVVKALRNMRERINNRYWYDWCDVLSQCQRDRQMRYVLPGIVSRLSEMRRIQMETDTTIRKQLSDYIITVLIVIGSIPMMGAMMLDWYTMLTVTPVGKITMAVVLAAVLSTSVWVARLYRPVEGGENK